MPIMQCAHCGNETYRPECSASIVQFLQCSGDDHWLFFGIYLIGEQTARSAGHSKILSLVLIVSGAKFSKHLLSRQKLIEFGLSVIDRCFQLADSVGNVGFMRYVAHTVARIMG